MPAAAHKVTGPRTMGGITLDDLKAQLDKQDSVTSAIRGDQTIQAGILQRVETALNKVVTTLGDESEDGKGGYTGTGLIGRVRRNERETKRLTDLYHRWIAYGMGFMTCAGVFLIALWWLVGDKLAIVFKGH